MRQGFIGGFLTGAVLSVAALAAVSVMAGLVSDQAPRASAPEVPAGSQFNRAREDRTARMPAPDASPDAEALPAVSAPAPDDLSPLEGADTAPATPPETGSPQASLAAPQTRGDGTGVAVFGDEPVLPSPQALPPEEPASDAGLAAVPIPAAPPEPAPAPASDGAATETGGQGADAGAPRQEPAGAQPAADAAQAPADRSISAEPAQPRAPEVETGSGPFADGGRPAREDAAQGPESVGSTPPGIMPDAAGAEAAMGEPDEPGREPASGTIGNLAQGVTTGRLPAVTDAPATSVTPAGAGEMAALDRFAAPFANPDGKPLMAIVLIDDGASPVSFEALADFPYPISYAIDADWSGAAEAAGNYRAAGLEVLALVDLPETADARDTEVVMQGALRAVPQAVAVMEGPGPGLQSSRAAAAQLVPILKDDGLGLVLFSEGLDTTRKLIAREGVPVAPVFRDFDAEGQNARVIRRFLDQAAFRAAQEEGGVVMVGRLRAETVSALLLWGLQDRAGSVALAPISAVLRATRG